MKRHLTPEQYHGLWREVTRDGAAPCWYAGWSDRECWGPLDADHLLDQRLLAQHHPSGLRGLSLTDLLLDARGCVPACRRHHQDRHARVFVVPYLRLPDGLHEFAAELGLVWYLRKHHDERRDVHLRR